jgi:hypothetical protein
MEFKKYQHIERFGTDETQGIELGISYVFPKIDGTNSSVWLKGGELKAGSRNRELTLDNDNAGFYAYVLTDIRIKNYLDKHPTQRLYGEWLVPHSLKTYRNEAWRKFYVFDICIDKGEEDVEYIPYDIYKPMLDEFELEYIPPVAILRNGSYDQLINCLEKNGFLVEDGKGNGEGIVIKNYDFYNKYKRQTWAKIVTNEFKEKHNKAMGAPLVEGEKMVEERIVEDYCTTAFIEKEYAKIMNEKQNWKSEYIPMLLGRIYSELVSEEMWNVVKKYKNPTINFKTLNVLVVSKVKQAKQNIF